MPRSRLRSSGSWHWSPPYCSRDERCCAGHAATPPVAVSASIEVLFAFDLIPARAGPITTALLVSIAIFSVGRAVTRAMLEPARNLIGFDAPAANRLYRPIAAAVTTVAAVTL